MTDNDNTCAYDTSTDWVPLSLTFVEYPKGNFLGKLLALFSLTPFVILSGFLTLILFRRDLHTITFFIGVVINEICNYILKHILQEPRPLARNSLYSEYGMPSAHSQFMWFFASYMFFFSFIRLQYANSTAFKEFFWKVAAVVTCIIVACIVSYSRIYLQYHSWKQVIFGGLVGLFIGTWWFAIIDIVLTPYFPVVTSWKISEFLLLRDTTLIPNILWFEYTNIRHEARARARRRKSVSLKSQ
ncbi:dolichyldiphosphatase 1-like [Adelges cooleyi]|uniref:dolichyldiphosphatase 1-like n=1 Tax=Adelges cooleyi TaxID=133065 RepID=UPI0021803E1D|nr:dolichyldiphosphatase 1-like [Adelges cooleyi]